MSRDITTTIYTFDELADEAKEKAIDNVRDMLARTWDSHDTEDITSAMVYELAGLLKSPGFDQYGPGDFPGVDGVTSEGWELEGGHYWSLRGILDRTNAPNLPWSDLIELVELQDVRSGTVISVFASEEGEIDGARFLEHEKSMEQAVRDAMNEALSIGRKEMDYKESEESAREYIEVHECEFEEDGSLYY